MNKRDKLQYSAPEIFIVVRAYLPANCFAAFLAMFFVVVVCLFVFLGVVVCLSPWAHFHVVGMLRFMSLT